MIEGGSALATSTHADVFEEDTTGTDSTEKSEKNVNIKKFQKQFRSSWKNIVSHKHFLQTQFYQKNRLLSQR